MGEWATYEIFDDSHELWSEEIQFQSGVDY
jgi:hypothetical protein